MVFSGLPLKLEWICSGDSGGSLIDMRRGGLGGKILIDHPRRGLFLRILWNLFASESDKHILAYFHL